MDFVFRYILISNSWEHFIFCFFLMIFCSVTVSVILLLFLYCSYRRNNFSIDKMIRWKRIGASFVTAILLFTVLQPYIAAVLWGIVFFIIRCTDKKDRILLYAAEWDEYTVPNYKNDAPAKWQNKKQIENWKTNHAHYTLSQSCQIPEGLLFREVLHYYQQLKVEVPIKIIDQDRWKSSKLSWMTYFSGTYYLSIVNCKYVIELLDTVTAKNWMIGMTNIFIGISGFVFLIYRVLSLLISESDERRGKFVFNFEFGFFLILFLLCWILMFYQAIVK